MLTIKNNPYRTLLAAIAFCIVAVGAYLFVERAIAPSEGAEPAEKAGLIRLDSPLPYAKISSPLTVSGEARGYWYFEASFPLELRDASGKRIPLEPPYVMTSSDWMTEEYVPFSTTHTFPAQPAGSSGTLILHKDNPSGDPERDDSLIVPITF